MLECAIHAGRRPTDFPLYPAEVDGTELHGVWVARERHDIDLLIYCAKPRFAIVVENKIEAAESQGQLLRYEQVVKLAYPDTPSLLVYLTLMGDPPFGNSSWLPYRHSDIHRVLKAVRDQNQSAIGADVLFFLDHYLALIPSLDPFWPAPKALPPPDDAPIVFGAEQ